MLLKSRVGESRKLNFVRESRAVLGERPPQVFFRVHRNHRQITFCLRKPEEEKLLGDPESYVKNEDKPSPITSDHVDGSRRIGQPEVTVKHNLHDEKLIWCWGPMEGYSNAHAAARDRGTRVRPFGTNSELMFPVSMSG